MNKVLTKTKQPWTTKAPKVQELNELKYKNDLSRAWHLAAEGELEKWQLEEGPCALRDTLYKSYKELSFKDKLSFDPKLPSIEFKYPLDASTAFIACFLPDIAMKNMEHDLNSGLLTSPYEPSPSRSVELDGDYFVALLKPNGFVKIAIGKEAREMFCLILSRKHATADFHSEYL